MVTASPPGSGPDELQCSAKGCRAAAVWALRVLWARLTGGAAVPYPRMSPRQGFAKVYRYGQRGAPADVTDVPSREVVREVAREVREP